MLNAKLTWRGVFLVVISVCVLLLILTNILSSSESTNADIGRTLFQGWDAFQECQFSLEALRNDPSTAYWARSAKCNWHPELQGGFWWIY